MNRYRWLLLITIVWLTALPRSVSAGPLYQIQAVTATVKFALVNLYLQPSQSSAVIGTVTAGWTCNVEGRNDAASWLLVTCGASRGWIDLRSADPFAAPRIVANAYATDHDVDEMLAAVKYLRRIAAQDPLRALIAEELRPGPQVQTDADLIADFRARSGTVYHPSCTLRMGRDPAISAVDPDLRVRGVEGLRVCDASVFPTLIGGNTNAPSILVGWLGAERILGTKR